MEALEIEDLKILLKCIDDRILKIRLSYYDGSIESESLEKSRYIIEQMIKDREFEQSQTTLPKL